jgi:hypothetical protein
VAYGKKMVTERFATSNVYFIVDKLVSGAVRQLQRTFEKLGSAMGFIPGMDAIMKIGKMFIGIALGYIDECCLGYTFYKKEQSAFKSAADGVVIYAQNWKTLLKDAAKTTGIVVALVVGITLVLFLVFGLIIRLIGLSGENIIGQVIGFVAFLLACFIAWAVTKAFIDSYILVKMMVSYMGVAPNTTITFDLYEKLCGLSAKFKELFNKGQKESPTPAPANAAKKTAQPDASAAKDKPVFCAECGAKNTRGVKFCGSCGKPLR